MTIKTILALWDFIPEQFVTVDNKFYGKLGENGYVPARCKNGDVTKVSFPEFITNYYRNTPEILN